MRREREPRFQWKFRCSLWQLRKSDNYIPIGFYGLTSLRWRVCVENPMFQAQQWIKWRFYIDRFRLAAVNTRVFFWVRVFRWYYTGTFHFRYLFTSGLSPKLPWSLAYFAERSVSVLGVTLLRVQNCRALLMKVPLQRRWSRGDAICSSNLRPLVQFDVSLPVALFRGGQFRGGGC